MSHGLWRCDLKNTKFHPNGPPCCGCEDHRHHTWLYTHAEREKGKTYMGHIIPQIKAP